MKLTWLTRISEIKLTQDKEGLVIEFDREEGQKEFLHLNPWAGQMPGNKVRVELQMLEVEE